MAIKTHEPIPADHPVQPLKAGHKATDVMTCGHCLLSWDDSIATSLTPAPSGRCPFEHYHLYAEPKTRRRPLTDRVARGLHDWVPVMRIMLEIPSDSELQERTEKELGDMQAALDWMLSVLNSREEKATA